MSIIHNQGSFICVAVFALSAMVSGCKDCSKKKSPKVLRTHLADPRAHCRFKIPTCCKDHDDWTKACICVSKHAISIDFAGYGEGDLMSLLVSRTTLEKNHLIVDVCEKYDSFLNVPGRKMYVGHIAHLKEGTYWVTVQSRDGNKIHGKKKVRIDRGIPGNPRVFFNRSSVHVKDPRRVPTFCRCEW